MADKNQKEVDDNELVGAVTDHLDTIRQQMPKIIVGIVALIVVVFGIRYYLSSRDAAREAKSKNVVLFAAEQSAAGSVSTLDKQIEDFPDDTASKWAYLMKADSQLAQGLNRIFRDKTTGMESVNNAITNFEKAAKNAGEGDEKLKERALYGWARGLESIGEFDKAAAKYEEVVTDFEDSAFAKLAEIGIKRVNSPDNREFFVAFTKRENDVFTRPAPKIESAPSTNSGLPSRPDFTYPGEEPVAGTEPVPAISSEQNTPAKNTPAENTPAEDAVPESGDGNKATITPAKTESETPPGEQPPAPPKSSEDGKTETKADDLKKEEPAKSEPPAPPTEETKEAKPVESKSDPAADPEPKSDEKPATSEKSAEKKSDETAEKKSDANPPK